MDSWNRWRDDVFGDPYLVWHDGPDFRRLLSLPPEEVARMLPAGLDAEDPVAALSILAMAEEGRAPQDAEALLRTAAATATGTFLVRVAQALNALTGDESWAEPIASVLGSQEFWGVRIDAAIALATFTPTVPLIQTLDRAVRDPEYLVRYHSANALLRYAGRRSDISNLKLFKKITADDRASWAEAADKLTSDALTRVSNTQDP
ncbi:hypothetical protein [Actinophytocola sp.]|uniref:hypothetical protein n=1 Tax=Actinophytocola sp. TaxID=1872138 RepID=UPI002ED6B8F7